MCLTSSSSAEFSDSSFTSNSAQVDGGAVNALSARFRSSAVFEFNAAGGSGGALHFSGTCSNCKFASNSAVLGGAVFASGAVELTSNQVVRNRASEEGSAIYSIAELTVSDSLVANFINDLECTRNKR